MKYNINSITSLSHDLSHFKDTLKGDRIAVSEILKTLEERGIAMVLFFFALPMALPLPVPPGVNVMLATPLLFLTFQQMIGRSEIWMPQSITKKTISKAKLDKMLGAAIPWMKRLEVLSRPRLGFLTVGPARMIIGFCGVIMALTVCIPLPLTNTIPSLGIACMSVGILMRDGLAVLAGVLVGLAWILLLIVAGEVGIRLLLEFI